MLEKDRLALLSREDLERLVTEKTTDFEEILERTKKHAEKLEVVVKDMQDSRLTILELLKKEIKLGDDLTKAHMDLESSQSQLIHLDAISIIKTMVAAFVHQLNQPLTVMKLIVQAILAEKDESDPLCEDLISLDTQIRSMSDVINDIISLVKEGVKKPINVNEITSNTLELFSQHFRDMDIKVVKEVEPNLSDVNANPVQLKEVFANFIVNALNSFNTAPSRKKKEIVINTRELVEEASVGVTFTDTGCGIPGDAINKIFEPSFNKRPKWLAPGLLISYKIIKEHGGMIEVESKLGKGTTFTVKLPAIKR